MNLIPLGKTTFNPLTKAPFSAIVFASYEYIDDKRMYRYDDENSCAAFFAEPLLGGI